MSVGCCAADRWCRRDLYLKWARGGVKEGRVRLRPRRWQTTIVGNLCGCISYAIVHRHLEDRGAWLIVGEGRGVCSSHMLHSGSACWSFNLIYINFIARCSRRADGKRKGKRKTLHSRAIVAMAASSTVMLIHVPQVFTWHMRCVACGMRQADCTVCTRARPLPTCYANANEGEGCDNNCN